jgi:hypothetical protein
MIIHWKALEEHFLMVPLVSQFTHFWRICIFFNFSQKTSVLKELIQQSAANLYIEKSKIYVGKCHAKLGSAPQIYFP